MNLYNQRSTWWLAICYHQEQLDGLISSTDIKAYAYILHDRDIVPETGIPKKNHWHVLLQFYANNRGSWFKRFDSDDMGRLMIEPCASPEGAYLYLTHETPKAKKDGNFIYDKSEIVTTIQSLENEDVKTNKHVILYNGIMSVLNKEMTWIEFYKTFPEYILSARSIEFFAYEIIQKQRCNPYSNNVTDGGSRYDN